MNLIKMKISDLIVAEPFKSLFLIHADVLSEITKDMQEKGFDRHQPIIVWFDELDKHIVIDGHTRLQAAQNLGIEKIWVMLRRFKDETEAMAYAIKKQRNRRNLNGADILNFVEKIDTLFPRGGDRKSNSGNLKIDTLFLRGRDRQREFNRYLHEKTTRDSRKITAELIGISTYKVDQCRHILNHSRELRSEIRDINDGIKSIHQVYMASLAAQKREEEKQATQHTLCDTLQELKMEDFPSPHKLPREKLYDLVGKRLPSLYKQAPDMLKIREALEFLESKDEDLVKLLCEQAPIRRFLGSLFVSDFIAVLEIFGYKIEKPSNLKVIAEERQVKVKKKRPSPRPENSAARFNEPGFRSRAEIDRLMSFSPYER